MPTPIVQIENLSKRFVLHQDKSIKERILSFSSSRAHREDFWALRDVDFSIESGSTLGLVGHNGSGKSTLLKIIGGIIQPTTGRVLRRGRLAALLELGAGFHPDLTGRENVYLNASILGLSRGETDKSFDAIVAFSGIEDFIDTQVKFYSSGMYVRLAFAVAVHLEPDLLLVDEVLAVGDEQFQRKCLDKIAEFQREGRTIILVTHSADQVLEMCDRVVVLDRGRVIQDGDPVTGVQVLRESFTVARADDDDSEEHSSRPRSLSITDVRLSATSTELNGSIAAGSDVSIEVDFDIASAPLGWISGIDIRNGAGASVYGVNTQALGIDLPTKAGDHTLRITLPRVTLGGDKYRLYATAVTSSGEPIESTTTPLIFEMAPDRRGVGMVQFGVTGSLDPRG